jgi:UPF0716 protein FxsA
MLLRLFLLFTLVPVIEVYLIIKVGSLIGALNTVGLIILTALAGAWLARSQGLDVLMRIRGSLEQGVAPAREMIEAVMILAAGAVLLTPGFFTDVVGLFILAPPSRALLLGWLERRISRGLAQGSIRVRRF